MIYNALAIFVCGMFFVAFFGATIAGAIALVKSFFSKPFAWGDSLVLCMVLFMSVFALIGTYSIITMIGTPA
jgi:hypothetical protein